MNLLALAMWLMALMPGVRVHAIEGPVTVWRGIDTAGASVCWPDTRLAEVYYSPTLTANDSLGRTLSHELLHAVDCIDDGAFNGSPLAWHPDMSLSTDPAHSWVFWALAYPEQAVPIIEGILLE